MFTSAEGCRLRLSSISWDNSTDDSSGDGVGEGIGDPVADSPSESDASFARISSNSVHPLMIESSSDGEPLGSNWERAFIKTDAAASTVIDEDVGVFVATVDDAVVKASSHESLCEDVCFVG